MSTVLKRILTGGVLTAAFATAGARADTFQLNYEAPGVQNSTATFSKVGVETFEGLSPGVQQGFTADFGATGISGAYSGPNGVQINKANAAGGAGGKGNYAVAFKSDPYTLTLSQNVNYFGFWLSALDGGNMLTFYNNGVEVGKVTPQQVSAVTSLDAAYYGNPNARFAGKDPVEPFVFINFYDMNGSFNQVSFTEIGDGGYESDNQTVGVFTAVSQASPAVAAPGVPEPSTWAMLGLGFAGLGLAGRSGRRGARRLAIA